MEERENKREETASDAELQRLVEDFITQKQVLLIQVKKGNPIKCYTGVKWIHVLFVREIIN